MDDDEVLFYLHKFMPILIIRSQATSMHLSEMLEELGIYIKLAVDTASLSRRRGRMQRSDKAFYTVKTPS
jgi:hypothetical protein